MSGRVLVFVLIIWCVGMISEGRVLHIQEQKDASCSHCHLKKFRFDVFKVDRRSLVNSERIVPGGPDPKHHH